MTDRPVRDFAQEKSLAGTADVILPKDSLAQLGWWAHYRESIRLLSRNARLYLVGAFLFSLAHASYQLLFNLYLREAGMSETFIGNVLSFGATGAAMLALPAGYLLSRIRLKPILLGATVVYSSAVALLAFWGDMSQLWIFALISGMAMTFFRVSTAPFYMRNSSPTERPMLFSLGFAMIVLSGAIGAFAAGYLVTLIEHIAGDSVTAHRYALYIGAGLGLCAVIPFSFVKAKPPSDEEKRRQLKWSFIKRRLPLYGKLFTPFFLVGLGAGFTIPFLNIYFRDRFDRGTETIGIYFTAVQITTLIGTLAGPAIVRWIGKIRTVVATELLSVPFMLILAYNTNITLVVAAFLIRSAFMNMGQPVASNFTMEIVAREEQGIVNALMLLAWTGSWMISTAIGGSLIEKYGYEIPILITASLYTVSALLYYVFFRQSERNNGDEYEIDSQGATP